jgi:hypothetical protein
LNGKYAVLSVSKEVNHVVDVVDYESIQN